MAILEDVARSIDEAKVAISNVFTVHARSVGLEERAAGSSRNQGESMISAQT